MVRLRTSSKTFARNGWVRPDIPDTEYGTVKAYPIDAIEILRQRIEADANMLVKYRWL